VKFYGFVIIQIITVSCSGGTQHESQSTQVEKPWEQKIVTTEIHTYNQLGILDSTYKTETYFISGVQSSTTNFLVARTYNERNNLLRERTFQLFKTGTQLSEEKVFKYDLKNNLIETIEKFQMLLVKKTYFNTIQIIKRHKKLKSKNAYKLPQRVGQWTVFEHIKMTKSNYFTTRYSLYTRTTQLAG